MENASKAERFCCPLAFAAPEIYLNKMKKVGYTSRFVRAILAQGPR